MEDKLNLMYDNLVRDLVDLSQSRRAIENKWIIKIERNVYGTIDRYKA